MKNSKTLKNVIEVLTAFIYFCGFMTVAALVVHLLSRMGLFKDLIQSGRLSFDANGIQLFPKHLQPLWQLLFNIDLCNRAWKILLVLSFMSGTLETSGNAYLLPFTFQFTFNTGLLLAVPIVWVSGKILERGIAIAEATELTI